MVDIADLLLHLPYSMLLVMEEYLSYRHGGHVGIIPKDTLLNGHGGLHRLFRVLGCRSKGIKVLLVVFLSQPPVLLIPVVLLLEVIVYVLLLTYFVLDSHLFNLNL